MIRMGTFNLNNLFSRFNFASRIDPMPSEADGGLTLTFGANDVRVRVFNGNLVRQKNAADSELVGRRIREVMNAHVLAVQEVEHIEVLREFNREALGGLYEHVALVEGNDRRLIDVGVLSQLPLGAITSHQAARHSAEPNRRVFGRDLLQIEILRTNGDVLFTLFNTHLKSHYVPFYEDQAAGAARANTRRRMQAETIGRIIERQQRKGSRFVLAGDMNDPPDSPHLAPMLEFKGESLVNGLAAARETRPAKRESAGQGDGPRSAVWTHRFNPPGADALPEHELYDQIWLSPALAPSLASAHIDRRTKHSGDGSDHDPAWVVLEL